MGILRRAIDPGRPFVSEDAARGILKLSFSAADPLPFQIDHVIAQQHGGEAVLDNLAWCCLHCNKHKGPNIAGIDPLSDDVARLFHPRQQRWARHFRWRGATLIGLTKIARATI